MQVARQNQGSQIKAREHSPLLLSAMGVEKLDGALHCSRYKMRRRVSPPILLSTIRRAVKGNAVENDAALNFEIVYTKADGWM